MNSGFTTRKVKTTETLGEKLEEAREKASLSLGQLSLKISIQKKYLENLEKGEYGELPADVYVRGYLKSCAGYLGLDYAELIRLYERERGIEEKINNFQKEKKNIFHSIPIVITPRMLQISAIVLVIFGIFFYLWYQISGLSRSPDLSLNNPIQDKTVAESTITVVGSVELDSSLTINEQPILIDSEGNYKESIGLQEGVNVLKVTASNRFGKQTTIERRVMFEPSVSMAQKNEEEESEEQSAEASEEENKSIKSTDEIYIKVSVKERATWVQIEKDNVIVYSGTMLPDSMQEFKAREKITLSSGKANTTYVNFNGKDLGALGETGEVIREMNFTKDLVIAN
jgi:cytoskeletal protein RodZ